MSAPAAPAINAKKEQAAAPSLPYPPGLILPNAKKVVFCYDVVCPWAYIASCVIESLAAEYGATVEFEPVLLVGLKTLDAAGREEGVEGGQRSGDSMDSEAKLRNTRRELMRQAARHSVTLKFPSVYPVRSVAAMRVLSAVQGAERVKLTHALFRSYWRDGLDISSEAVLAGCITSCGIPPASVDREHGKEALIQQTQRAHDNGAFGVPTFFLHNLERGHEGTMYWGVSRLMFVRAALGDDTGQLMRVTSDPAVISSLPEVEMFFDLSSPWSFLAFTQRHRLTHLCQLKETPIFVGGLFRDLGVSTLPMSLEGPNKRAYTSADLTDYAQWWNEKLDWPDFFPVHSVLPQRILLVEPACAELLFRAIWQQGKNCGDKATCIAVLNDAGYRGEELYSRSQAAEVKQRLLDNTRRAASIGVFGVPTFRLQDELLWGQDRMDTLLDMLSGWKPDADAQPEPAIASKL